MRALGASQITNNYKEGEGCLDQRSVKDSGYEVLEKTTGVEQTKTNTRRRD